VVVVDSQAIEFAMESGATDSQGASGGRDVAAVQGQGATDSPTLSLEEIGSGRTGDKDF
jgi:hypothetical protein